MRQPLLQVHDLQVHFHSPKDRQKTVRAVDGVSFDIARGETLSLVGESGCGKTTAGRAILRLVQPTAGQVQFAGVELVSLRPNELRHFRRKLQIVFQDPFASLNPRRTIGAALSEAMEIHGIGTRATRMAKAKALLARVGLDPNYSCRYPHEFSGGQRQRVGIARALAVEPELIVCDEPVSALDVSVQAQVINLLQDLQAELGLSYLFIAHDLSVVHQISHRVAVMYLGKIVELAETEQLFSHPLHPYTKALLRAVPIPDPLAKQSFDSIAGELPSPLAPPPGCRFHPRCPLAEPRCSQEEPLRTEVSPGHSVACHQISGTKQPKTTSGGVSV